MLPSPWSIRKFIWPALIISANRSWKPIFGLLFEWPLKTGLTVCYSIYLPIVCVLRICDKYSKTCLKRPLKTTKIGFQDQISHNEGQNYCRMLQESILQYFRPSLSYHLSLRPLFCLFLNGSFRQDLLYLHSHDLLCLFISFHLNTVWIFFYQII